MTLNIQTLNDLSTLCTLAQTKGRVMFLDECEEISYGTVRAFVKDPDNAGFLGRGDDVRDACVWITRDSGLEWFPSVLELVENIALGLMVPVTEGSN